jgi:hypothetical protein
LLYTADKLPMGHHLVKIVVLKFLHITQHPLTEGQTRLVWTDGPSYLTSCPRVVLSTFSQPVLEWPTVAVHLTLPHTGFVLQGETQLFLAITVTMLVYISSEWSAKGGRRSPTFAERNDRIFKA